MSTHTLGRDVTGRLFNLRRLRFADRPGKLVALTYQQNELACPNNEQCIDDACIVHANGSMYAVCTRKSTGRKNSRPPPPPALSLPPPPGGVRTGERPTRPRPAAWSPARTPPRLAAAVGQMGQARADEERGKYTDKKLDSVRCFSSSRHYYSTRASLLANPNKRVHSFRLCFSSSRPYLTRAS